jgi:hypothetical protein
LNFEIRIKEYAASGYFENPNLNLEGQANRADSGLAKLNRENSCNANCPAVNLWLLSSLPEEKQRGNHLMTNRGEPFHLCNERKTGRKPREVDRHVLCRGGLQHSRYPLFC